jgi:hypothetical protein
MKILFFLSIAVYAGLMVLGGTDAHYRDEGTANMVFNKALIYLIILSVLIGGGFFFWFQSVFPRWHQKQNAIGRIGIPLVFVLLSFAFNRWIMLLYNNYGGNQETIYLSGPVVEKYYEKRRRGRTYYLIIQNNRDQKQYQLRLTRKAYEFLGDSITYFDKEFKVGALGVIYRREL